ncbi:NAD(+)--rifampin ADP-ribosyltransferase [Demequina sp.]|uniref:NAD(+)--rifampin ADP-ribosyltransferase n=1 Tax=Demequina sp. TaxID=2050685 RepID=UPI003D0BB189
MPAPVAFEEYPDFLHGTKAVLSPGDLLRPGVGANFGTALNHVYFTKTLDAAAWGAELAVGEATGRIYVVEPTGDYEDDPNLTDKKFPGNPTRSYRSTDPVRIVRELEGWEGHSQDQIDAMRAGLAALNERGEDTIIN